ncbi:MAG TPA: isoprenylcysteine carboxylmethyltransferase family protein [Rhizomicrobium sp.]
MHAVVPDYLFNEHPLWSAVYWATFVVFFASTAWVQSRERGAPRGDMRDRGSKSVIYLISMIGYAAIFAAPSLVPSARIDLPAEPVFATAMALIWIGLLLYIWAVLTLGAFFRTSVQLLDGQRLVRRGPYRLLRHPAYSAGILLLSGLGLATGNWVSALIAPLAAVIAYAWRIHVEEAALRERFGAEFESHRRRTWAVIPLVW